jgi:hypothetical protein
VIFDRVLREGSARAASLIRLFSNCPQGDVRGLNITGPRLELEFDLDQSVENESSILAKQRDSEFSEACLQPI